MVRIKITGKDVNFLPQSMLQKKQARDSRTRRIQTALLAGFLAGVIFSFPKYVESQETYRLELLTARYRELEKGRPYRQELVDKQKQYRAENAVVEKLSHQNSSVISIIDAVHSVLPPGLWVTDMEVEAGKAVRLKCEATSALAAARFMAGLDELGLFEKVETSEVPLGKGVNSVEFFLPLKAGVTDAGRR